MALDQSVPRMDHSSHIVPSPQRSPSPPAHLFPHSLLSLPPAMALPDIQPSISPLSDQNGLVPSDDDLPPSTPPDVDPQILEALRNKDRIYVLKLGEAFEALIMERRSRVEVSPTTSYQRLLVHRCSAYYKLVPENDPVSKGIFVVSTLESRIPDRRISELVPAESTTQPSFKIMRRSAPDRRSKPHSHAGSVAGEDGDSSDVEPSEAGSLGGRSSGPTSSSKKRMTIEEREAAYNEARSRIFMDFEEKGKDKDASASSSSLSLNGSTSTSAGGRSDMDDSANSPATESEWSAPSGSALRDKKDGRRGGVSTNPPSNRSLRAGGSFHTNGSGGSSRNSRAPSPSFSYASLHDSSPTGQIYDPSQHHNPSVYYPSQYYPYPPPAQGPTPPFMAPYPYYPPYNPYQPPPPIPQHTPDPSTAPGHEPYSPPLQMYQPHYAWPPHQPPLQSPPHLMHMLPPQQSSQNPQPQMGPPPSLQPQSPQYQPFVPHSHGYTYPMNAYYPPPPPPPPPPPHGQQMPPPPPHMNMQHQQPQPLQHHPGYDASRSMNGAQINNLANGHFNNNNTNNNNGTGPRNGLGNGVILPNNNGRANSRNGGGPSVNNNSNGTNGGKQRLPPPPAGRSAWSYGPGIGYHNHPSTMGTSSNNNIVGESMGPRFNLHRHGSGSNSRSSQSDDVASTVSSSSTTSSSSRRTYTSTTSSQQHPLPPRPDWAVGLKAQPTLTALGGSGGGGGGVRHHDHTLTSSNSRGISPISPPRSNGHNSPMPGGHHQQHQHQQHQHQQHQHQQHNQHQHQHNQNHAENAGSSPAVSVADFPPLTSTAAVQEKFRTPIVTGAWGVSRPTTNGAPSTTGTQSPAQHSPILIPTARQEENGVKVGEPFNPKLVRRPVVVNQLNGQAQAQAQSPHHMHQRGSSAAKGADAVGALVEGVLMMSFGEENGFTGVDALNPISIPGSAPAPALALAPVVVVPAAAAP